MEKWPDNQAELQAAAPAIADDLCDRFDAITYEFLEKSLALARKLGQKAIETE